MPARTSPKPQTRTTTLLNEVLKADPGFYAEANNPVVYRFSNGRQFRENYKKSGPYVEDTWFLLADDGRILEGTDGVTPLVSDSRP